jgi:Fibronectin type III domain
MTRTPWRRSLVAAAAFATLLVLTTVPAGFAGATTPAPRGVHAAQTAGVVVVSWSRPLGGPAVSAYVVTAHPSNVTCTSKSTSCVMKHLSPSASYDFTVVARSAKGTSASSPSSDHVRIPSAKDNYLAAVDKLNTALSKDQDEIDSSATSKQLTAALTDLGSAYDAFNLTLAFDEWPASARSDIAALIGDVKALSLGWTNAYEATAANASTLFATLQGEENKQIEKDAVVRTDLGLTQVITGPVTTPPSPATLGSPAVVHDFTGDALSVTASQVVDPATAAAGSGLPDAGYRFVAVELNLSDTSGGEVEGNVNFSTTVIGSDNQTYTADFGSVSTCSNPVYGIFILPGGDSSSGCVVFELPAAVSVQSVEFSLAPGYLDTAEWND